ncbi:bifunctional RNase H/acid phosphatase [Roseivivax jejudonensis]|uniref:Bifunctional RNase H/acid phosphatase n=1 Tax=Roseivivax jejudonensis TaxID=1529041 RepID=A0A1X6ZMS6_9RHOB|nr:bifunctional RNase H/acid phosphatase [Roseivivax jejudonensis]
MPEPAALPPALLLVRHAPADHGGRLTGRRDVPACLPPDAALDAIRRAIAGARIVASPARRCRETAAALAGGVDVPVDARLWEQDFGTHEGVPFADLPDLGPMSRVALAAHRYPGGESFLDMAARVAEPLSEFAAEVRNGARIAVIAHAGTVRAALALALGDPADALGFEVAPLSVTRLTCWPGGLSVACVNWSPE